MTLAAASLWVESRTIHEVRYRIIVVLCSGRGDLFHGRGLEIEPAMLKLMEMGKESKRFSLQWFWVR